MGKVKALIVDTPYEDVSASSPSPDFPFIIDSAEIIDDLLFLYTKDKEKVMIRKTGTINE